MSLDDFLKELTELSRKHKIYINGCGCCGSPYLTSPNWQYPVDDLVYLGKRGYKAAWSPPADEIKDDNDK